MDEILISIVIPVYNAEKYIDLCMNSILAQTFKQYEIVLVDDGSTDHSPLICDNYAAKYDIVKVIHKENGGVSSARNYGMKVARGEYIAFVDIDDTLDEHYLEILYTNAIVYDADISCCDCSEIEPGNNRQVNKFRNVISNRMITDYRELIFDYFTQQEFYGYVVWGKIIRKKLAMLETMEPLKYGEDSQYMIKLFLHKPTVYLDEYKGYNYIRWTDSATMGTDTLRLDRLQDKLLLDASVLKYCKHHNDGELIDMASQRYAKDIYAILSLLIKRNDKDKYDTARRMLLISINEIVKLKSIEKKHRLMLAFYGVSPQLYWIFVSSLLKIKKKKKAAIITIYDPLPNYGNRLQNYAVQKVLRQCKIDNVTIAYENSKINFKKRIKYVLQCFSNYKLPGSKQYWQKTFPQFLSFEKFNKKYIHTKYITHLDDIVRCDYYVLGSDQVWNTAWYHEDDMKKELFLLTFAQPEQKVCFSPSFGTDTLSNEWSEWFREHLKSFPSLSVREEAGQRIINNLIGKDAVVLIDPTMMLDATDWMKIAKKPKKLNCDKPYILTYFLGGRSEQVNHDLCRLANQYHAHVYNLMDMDQPDVYVSGPSEFIYLISRAQMVLTDSFHACVFSFLFNKPFLVYPREGNDNNMMSRMDTLLKKFHLERKYVNSGLPNKPLERDYQKGYEVLAQERKKTLNYLKSVMNL